MEDLPPPGCELPDTKEMPEESILITEIPFTKGMWGSLAGNVQRFHLSPLSLKKSQLLSGDNAVKGAEWISSLRGCVKWDVRRWSWKDKATGDTDRKDCWDCLSRISGMTFPEHLGELSIESCKKTL